MAVEAHHLHPFPSQLLSNGREILILSGAETQPNLYYDMRSGFASPASGVAAAAGSFLRLSDPRVAFDSGLIFNDAASTAAAAAAASRKRLRSAFLGDDMTSHLPQQMLDIDRLILQHAEKVRAELAERRKRFTRQILAAVEEGVAKRLRAKEEEIARIGKVNWALEERIKSLCVENQIWRDLAQSTVATANMLRTNLEQVLAAQARVKEEEEEEATAAAPDAVDDAESCCCGDNAGEEEIKTGVPEREWRRACLGCGEGEPSVLLLPCRHLCLCAACGPAVDACPICRCCKTGSIHLNLS